MKAFAANPDGVWVKECGGYDGVADAPQGREHHS